MHYFLFFLEKTWIILLFFFIANIHGHVIYIHSINNGAPRREARISFISVQEASKIFFFCVFLFFLFPIQHVDLMRRMENEDPYLLFRCWMLPRHLKRPFTMMAMRVHRASHSSMLSKERRGHKWDGAVKPDIWVLSLGDYYLESKLPGGSPAEGAYYLSQWSTTVTGHFICWHFRKSLKLRRPARIWIGIIKPWIQSK